MTDETTPDADAAAALAKFEALPQEIKNFMWYFDKPVVVELRHPVSALTCRRIIERGQGPEATTHGVPTAALDDDGQPIGAVHSLVGILRPAHCGTRLWLAANEGLDPADATVISYYLRPDNIETVAEVAQADSRHVQPPPGASLLT